jgi:hypothetical protein
MDLWSVLTALRPYATYLGLALLLLGVATAGVTANAHLGSDPEQVTVNREVGTVSATTSYRTAATVTGNSSLYDSGARLVNRSTYVVGATPRVDVRLTTVFDRNVTGIDGRLLLEHRVTVDGDEVWHEQRFLDRGRVDDAPGVITSGTLNATALLERRDEVRRETGGRGTLSTRLVSRTYFEDPVTGERRVRTRTLEVGVAGGALLSLSPVDGAGPTRRYTQLEETTTTRPDPVPWPRYGAGLGLALLGVGVLWVRRRESVLGRSILDTEPGAWERTLGRYSEWISSGSLVYHETEEAVPVGDVAELVKIAMNNRGGLVHCDTTDMVAYIDGDVTYYCQGPNSDWDPRNTLRSAFGFADSGDSGTPGNGADVAGPGPGDLAGPTDNGNPAADGGGADEEFGFDLGGEER